MEVMLWVSRAGANFSQSAGDIITVDDDEGLRMIAAGQCELVESKPEIATAKSKIEKATAK